jgi:signal transduction histidine kinase
MTGIPLGKASRIAFSLTFIALLVNAVMGCWTVEELTRSGQWVAHTHEVIAALEKAFSTLKDGETGVRGYLLAGDRDYLAPYELAKRSIDPGLKYIADLTVDNPVQQDNIKRLASLVHGRFDVLAATLQAAETHGVESRKYLPEMAAGRQVMQRIRELVDLMTAEEERLLEYRREMELGSRFLAFLSSVLGFGLGGAMVGSSILFAIREVQERQRAAAAVVELNEQLERRVRQRTIELATTNDQLNKEVSERRRAEQSAHELAANLQRSNQELERFASVASHDLQEPLRKIQAFGDRLLIKRSDALGDQGRDYLGRMLNSAERMRRLIDDLLAFSRVSTKGTTFVTVDLNTMTREVLGDLEARIQDTNAQVEVGELPPILADPLQIRQLLQNLIGNALKFRRPDAAPKVKVEGKIIAEGPAVNGQPWKLCELRVSDNGIGFEETYLDRIFEVFQRLHGRAEYEGTGMGLAICRRIAERHGGSITASSTPGVGSTFVVRLPASQLFLENS